MNKRESAKTAKEILDQLEDDPKYKIVCNGSSISFGELPEKDRQGIKDGLKSIIKGNLIPR